MEHDDLAIPAALLCICWKKIYFLYGCDFLLKRVRFEA